LKAKDMERLIPKVEYQGETVIVMTPQVASVPRKKLSEPVGSLARIRTGIVGAPGFAVEGV
jgi:toxin CcdB